MRRDEPTLWAVLAELVRHPQRELLAKWNYKSAIASALLRGGLFFATNLSAGADAAALALVVEAVFRFATAGFYGALTQAFRRVVPARVGTLAAIVVLPIVAHGLELVVHWTRETPNLAASIAASLCFTVCSTSFNLFAMRHSVLVVGESDSRSIMSDLRRLPRLIAMFLQSLVATARSAVSAGQPGGSRNAC